MYLGRMNKTQDCEVSGLIAWWICILFIEWLNRRRKQWNVVLICCWSISISDPIQTVSSIFTISMTSSRLHLYLLFLLSISALSYGICIYFHSLWAFISLLHLTDLHFLNKDSNGYHNLLFLNHTLLPAIQPDYVVVSGDLSLGYRFRFISSSQSDQWNLYRDIWSKQTIVPHSHWFDVPGNHDYTLHELSGDSWDITQYSSMGTQLPVFVRVVSKTSLCIAGIDSTYSPSGWILSRIIHRSALLVTVVWVYEFFNTG